MAAMIPDGRDLSGKRSRHPFIHEYLYRKVAAVNTGGELGNPDLVLKPLISEYLKLQDSILNAGASGLAGTERETLAALRKQPWWWVMPSILPPYRSHHQFGMTYTTYRQMSTGNMTFLVGRDLARALYNTDYDVRFGELKFPSDTFIIYFQDSIAPVGPSHLTWVFVDIVPLFNGRRQMRVVYGFIDEDGDDANSDFLLLECSDDLALRNDQFVEQLDRQKVSNLSLQPITAVHRQNVLSVFASLVNVLLYLEAAGDISEIHPDVAAQSSSGLRNPKKLRRREKELENRSIFRYSYVGRGYEARLAPESGNPGIPLEHRILVRGHWRHQWTGPQRDDEGNRVPGTARRLYWIEPYWKGPDAHDGRSSVRVVR